ncbi:hypothetical protein DTO006G1_9381 [Penicillium roqueforti]|nr:hypothetical protein DTO006G1_9381 [Penicillium roqueforti]KAI3249011.1 hypothetical protein DTO006G7_9555 [Penicillium roqueforti]
MGATKSKQKKQKSQEDTLSVEHQQKKAKMSTCRDPKYDYPRYTHKEYLREIREMKNLIEAGMLGWPGPGNKDDMFHTLTFTVGVQSFVIEHAKVKPEDVDHLSDTQKQTIISHLAGYCVQEKWEVLMGLLPDLVREKVLEVFLETLIYKDIFERFFVNFFWYFDGKMSPTDEGDETFTARLKHLYDQFYATNPLMAALWRSETNRLANSTDIRKASDTLLGTYHLDRRQSFIGQFVDNALSSEPIRWLLKETSSTEEADRRHKDLCRIYHMAMESAAELGNIRGHIDLEMLATLPRTFTSGERMQSHEYNLLHEDSNLLDGQRILMVVYPGIVRRYICALEKYVTEYSTAAYVVVEEQAQ